MDTLIKSKKLLKASGAHLSDKTTPDYRTQMDITTQSMPDGVGTIAILCVYVAQKLRVNYVAISKNIAE